MKTFLLATAFLITSLSMGQAFTGKGDQKFQVGLNLQDNATGLHTTYDFGIGQNISLGVAAIYALGVNSDLDADFGQRADVRLRFNANIGSVLDVDPMFDFYPGLSFGTKNFGGHLGARYFFSEGFGLYTEAQLPFARYDTGTLTAEEELNNQFNFNLGMTFNL